MTRSALIGGMLCALSLTMVPAAAAERQAGSRVLGKSDKRMVDGSTACIVRFVYAGQEPEVFLWEEPCADVDAGMIGQDRLVALGWWSKLDADARGFIAKMPGGQVLYVSGKFAASVIPVGTAGLYEVPVAD